ncbi:hypothetical protein Q0590_10170 [Rhodocytophaga aerolata]|uniref:DUF304 domain-containing protein n=1 Tax=Rhodocytophaga aerolata TaxID=455078 RepID=A0ABT8R3E3_9BACT|nr:hypothetical protein [Rhodocytophaga aerolata]MDO1446617.1 hypothetical protein [Rhodocytophaga aerolata]
MISTSAAPSLLSFIGVCFILALLVFVAVRIAVGYISLQADGHTLTVTYKVLGKRKIYALASVTHVEEVNIKTFQNKHFRQLLIYVGDEKISFNDQVYTGYDGMKQLLNQRKAAPKNKLKKK